MIPDFYATEIQLKATLTREERDGGREVMALTHMRRTDGSFSPEHGLTHLRRMALCHLRRMTPEEDGWL